MRTPTRSSSGSTTPFMSAARRSVAMLPSTNAEHEQREALAATNSLGRKLRVLTAGTDSGSDRCTTIIPLRTSRRRARAPQIHPPMSNRCASASRPILESIPARVRLAGGCLETLIWQYFCRAHRPLTLSPGCSQVSSAPGGNGQPPRKRPCAENPQPVGHAAPRGLLNP